MLDRWEGNPTTLIGTVAPSYGDATIEKIAINAVMAGCLPEHLPAVIAAVKAMTEKIFNLYALQSTTHPCTVMALLSGPLADELDIMGAYRPYPPRRVGPPESVSIRELFPCHFLSSTLSILTILEPQKVNLPYRPEALIISRFNPMVSTVDRNRVAEMLAKMDFVLCFAIYPDETTEFADVVIPEAHDYERWCLFPANSLSVFVNSGPGVWQGQVLQPVVDPPEGVRHWAEFMMDVADRLGLLAEMNEALNARGGFGTSAEDALSLQQKYTIEKLAKFLK